MAQVFGDQRSSAVLLITQLRMLVDVVAPGDGFWLDCLGAAGQAFVERVLSSVRGESQGQEQGREQGAAAHGCVLLLWLL